MKKTILTFGLISGFLSSAMMMATVPFLHSLDGSKGYILGYTTIVLSFLLVYFGIRSYRDNVGGGSITFGRGFAVGILITLISCLFYVATWEVVYFHFIHGMMVGYYAKQIAAVQASGASAQVMQTKLDGIAKMKAMYENPLFNAAITFVEPFPVGVVITLVSAAVLRRRRL